jgi:FtsZ-interacting cell division protein YlmF
MPDLVGVAEIAGMIGISRQRVNELVRTDPGFPEPEAELAAGRIWTKASVEAWMIARSRAKRGSIVKQLRGVTLVQPSEFARDAELVGDTFMQAKPVILDLRQLDVLLLRRFFDFAAGLAYGLKGSVGKLKEQVLLLEPENVKVPARERHAILEQL